MAEKKRKGGGGKLSRSEVVTVRFDPKLRWGAELAARKQRRTLSSFIEWAVEDALSRYMVNTENDYPTSMLTASREVWDVDEADRLAKLALYYPELLNHDEQVLWKLITETGWLWKGDYGTGGKWTWEIHRDYLMLDRLREWWPKLIAVMAGELSRDELPETNSKKPEPDDEDVPF